jgi:AcrR family transcriptional regulator
MKDQIVHKATELFLNFGFKSVTMDDIARELGMSKKTIYVHFSNKTALIETVSAQLFCTIQSGIDLISSQTADPIEELFKIKDFVNENLNNEQSSPVFQLQKYYPKLFKNLIKRQREIVKKTISDNIKRGIEMGLYRKNLNKEFIWRIYFAGINIIKNDDLFPLDNFPKKEVNDLYLEYHLRAMVTDKGLTKLNDLTH